MAEKVPEQNPEKRVNNFEEVCLGYSEEQAIKEAKRCLQCKNPQCVPGCPVNINIPAFIKKITEKDHDGALQKIKESSNLPGVCGRVCPQEKQCEAGCILRFKKDPIAIGKLERFAADHGKGLIPKKHFAKNKKIAIIGSGPAGLTCASDLNFIGYKVTIFEALHVPGGVMMYGIPEFRLPKKIVQQEIDIIKEQGVEIKTDYIIGKTISLKQLRKEFDALFIANGAGTPYFMNIPGEDLIGVYSANEFLTRVNLMKGYDFPNYDTPVKKGKKVVVVGGGNVAMDAARTAKRLGADVIIAYRRSKHESP
ncbi:MAG: FAD-dependent oxidoreductase, partial [Candidatus Woesearchaeota archaeon]